MKVLKKYLHILPTVALIFIVNIGLANTNGKENKAGQEQEQEGRRKSNQEMIQPDGDVPSESVDEDLQEEISSDFEPSESNSKIVYQPAVETDTVKEAAVSKYNFIFYFLYKFKYDVEEAP